MTDKRRRPSGGAKVTDGLTRICIGNLVVLASLTWPFPRHADAFNVFDVLQNGIARWNSVPYEVDGVKRSLDGGLRYSLQGGSYVAFRDLLQWAGPPPGVADFQAAVEAAFTSWETVDPATSLGTDLRFVPDLQTQVLGEPFVPDLADRFQLNRGAEIDLIVDDLDFGIGLSNPYFDPYTDVVTLTSGVSDYPAAVMSGVDIYFNRDTTWDDVTYFQFTLAHEIGHALGLGDVDAGKGGFDAFTDYYDDNFDGASRDTARATLTNSFADLIDPFDPNNSPGLTPYDVCAPADEMDPFSCVSDPGVRTSGVEILMESSASSRANLERPFLQNDDFAGRQFLYPFVPPSETLAGDYNEDGVVNAADYTVWRNNLGAPAGTLPNDTDGGVIGAVQYDTWKADFGMTATALSAHESAVPEPPVAWLMIMGLVWLGKALRHDRHNEQTGR